MSHPGVLAEPVQAPDAVVGQGQGPPEKIGGLYCLGRKLGAGSFGDIFFVVNTQTGEELAVKVEKARCLHPQLMHEAKLLKHLQGAPGFATVHWFDTEGDYNVLVMDLLGLSLESFFSACNRKFSLKTVLMVADQMLCRAEYMHSKSFIHRDIKPDNFLVGYGRKCNTLYLIDFGLAKKYRDPKSRKHICLNKKGSFTGTARFASVSSHLGFEQSRRDDLEAIGYVLVYFMRGQLPWQGLQASTKEEKHQRIMECKRTTPLETLCEGFPMEFTSYLEYCRGLNFEDKPDYAHLRRLFKDLFTRMDFVNDGMFDWSKPNGISGSSSSLFGNMRNSKSTNKSSTLLGFGSGSTGTGGSGKEGHVRCEARGEATPPQEDDQVVDSGGQLLRATGAAQEDAFDADVPCAENIPRVDDPGDDGPGTGGNGTGIGDSTAQATPKQKRAWSLIHLFRCCSSLAADD